MLVQLKEMFFFTFVPRLPLLVNVLVLRLIERQRDRDGRSREKKRSIHVSLGLDALMYKEQLESPQLIGRNAD